MAPPIPKKMQRPGKEVMSRAFCHEGGAQQNVAKETFIDPPTMKRGGGEGGKPPLLVPARQHKPVDTSSSDALAVEKQRKRKEADTRSKKAQEDAYWAEEEVNKEMYNGTWNSLAEFFVDGQSDFAAESDAWKVASP